MNRVSSEILDRMPPANLEAERAIIGSVMHDPKMLDSVVLDPEEFYGDANQILWRVFRTLRNNRRPIDVITILDTLESSGELAAAGGSEYLATCAQSVPWAANAPYYAGIIRQKAKLRAIIHAATEALRDAHDETSVPETVLANLEGALGKIGTGSYSSREPIEYSAAVMNALDRIEEINQRKQLAGILTGFERFDRDIGGLFPGELNILAARPGQGKTAAAMQIALHAGMHGHRVYVATLEMGATELAMRQLCAAAKVPSQRVRTGSIGQEDIRAFTDASMAASRANIVIHDWPQIRVYDIRRAAMRAKAEFIVVDYLQLVRPEEVKNRQRYEQIGAVASALKALAREMKIPVLALAQLNRAVEAGKELRPRLSHLRESGNIEQDADVVILIYRPEGGIKEYPKSSGKADKGVQPIDEWDAYFDLAKNRNGPGGQMFKMDWCACRTQFSDHCPELF